MDTCEKGFQIDLSKSSARMGSHVRKFGEGEKKKTTHGEAKDRENLEDTPAERIH